MSDHSTTNGPESEQPSSFGTFFGRLLLEPLPEGRLMQVVEPFGFRNHDATEWPVPAEARTDGASIPRALWTLIGGPFEGKYRKSAVVHDYYCSTRTAPWRDVHRIFYNGMRASGVSGRQAKLLYSAVYFAGPRWSEMDVHNARLEHPQGRFAEELVATKALHYWNDPTNKPHFDLRLGDVAKIIARIDPSPDEIADGLDHLLSKNAALPPRRRRGEAFEELYLDSGRIVPTITERYQGSTAISLSCVVTPGQRVRLLEISLDPAPLPARSEGTVEDVTAVEDVTVDLDYCTHIKVRWDCGTTLELCSPPDRVEVIA